MLMVKIVLAERISLAISLKVLLETVLNRVKANFLLISISSVLCYGQYRQIGLQFHV